MYLKTWRLVIKKTKLFEKVRIMRFDDIYTKWHTKKLTAKKLTAEQAAEVLAVHKRTFRRQCRAI